MNKWYIKTITVAALILFVQFNASAQWMGSIAYYLGGSGITVTTNGEPNLTVYPIQAVGFGSGVTCTTGGLSGITVSTVWATYSPAAPHIMFKVKPNPGCTMNISSFNMGLRKQTGGPASAKLAYSLDNGATWLTDGGHSPGALSCEISTLCTWSGGTLPITVTDTTNGIIFAAFMYASTDSTAPCQVNDICIFGGIFCNTPQITAHSISNVPDTVCSGVDFYIASCGDSSSGLRVVSNFGDGSADTSLMDSMMTGAQANIYHSYALPGTYFVKQVLFSGSAAVDSVSFSYESLSCNTFPVKFYYDANSDCAYDAGDTRFLEPVRLEVDSNGVVVDTISCAGGFYYKALGAPIGAIYTFKMISLSTGMIAACPSSGIFYDTVQYLVNNYAVKYIGVTCATASALDLSVNATIPITGHMDQSGNIYVRNTSCTPVDATVTLTYSPKYTFSWGNPAPVSTSGNTATWLIPGIDANTSATPVALHYLLWYNSTLLTYGDTVISTFKVSPTAGDADTTNNVETIVDTVRASCDPNAMWVSPQGYIAAGTQLQYTINFENTGNDTAHDIYVLDTLSGYVDHNSIDIVTTTAEMNMMLVKSGGLNIMKFDFPGIDLLDSTHHGMCDGGLVFNIKTLAGLPDGTEIFNRAGIYFDDNAVVMTNQVEDIIGIPTGVQAINKKGGVVIFPNPTDGELTIKMDNNAYSSFSITNGMGQLLVQKELSSTQTKVDITMISAGLYYIIFKGDNGTHVEKFVKE